ncbi:MAG TPA: L-histidine N(alpha)-methyltransferase [Mariprofundaceae bacterium]|nr:L-histidine N(alpha)-methyltransferase [Mariprofundaceae bacterium]
MNSRDADREDGFTVHQMPTSSVDELTELIEGLSADQPWISPRFFYDQKGSELFDRITRTPEYYPTRTEEQIFARHLPEMLAASHCSLLLEPGSGNCEKAERFFRSGDISHYVPIEFSADFLIRACRSLRQRYPNLYIDAICADFTSCEALPESVPEQGRMLFFPGSTIGNFDPDEAVALMKRFRAMVGPGGYALIGVDLQKDPSVLDAAYNDSAGLTAAFNLNALYHLNARLGCDFRPEHFMHRAFYDEEVGRVEMHLVCRDDTEVGLGDHRVTLHAGQSIHTESSWKYTKEGFHRLAGRADFEAVDVWTDPRQWFSVHLLRAGAKVG